MRRDTSPRLLRATTAEETAFVARGYEVFAERFVGTHERFENLSWDVRALERSRHKRTNARVYFTLHDSLTEPLPQRFADVIKTFCIVEASSKSHLITRVGAARMLWRAMHDRLGGNDERFSWRSVNVEDFLAAERHMLATGWAQGTTYVACNALQRMIEVLAGAHISGQLDVPFRTRKPDITERYTLDDKAAHDALLPSEAAMAACADIYAVHAVEPADRLLACVLALLAGTGMRIGEVLTLPDNCLVSKGEGENRVWGVRFNKEKSPGQRRGSETRWLTPEQAGLVRPAIEEVLRLTGPARARAGVLEAHPDTVPLPSVEPSAELTTAEVADLLGVSPSALLKPARQRRNNGRRPRPAAGKRLAYRVEQVTPSSRRAWFRASDVMAYLHERRGSLWVVRRTDGSLQALSETLFITFRHAFGRVYRNNPLLVDPITERTVADFLIGRGRPDDKNRIISAFERFEIRETSAELIRMTSKQFRHWVTTLAARAGIDDGTLARWQNREHTGDLQAYKHLTPAERVTLVKDALRRGQLRGRLAEMYFALAEDVRDVFLEDHLQAVHVTPFGLCVHDFKVAPCPKKLNCVKHCRDYLHDTADAGQRARLEQLRENTLLVLDQAERQAALDQDDLSENWVAEARETMIGVDEILAAKPFEGATTLVRPFPDAPSRFRALVAD